jgi:hypothetical protein
VREAFPDIQAQLPNGLTGEIVYDSTDFVNSSISEGVKTLVEALADRGRRDLPVPRLVRARCSCRWSRCRCR